MGHNFSAQTEALRLVRLTTETGTVQLIDLHDRTLHRRRSQYLTHPKPSDLSSGSLDEEKLRAVHVDTLMAI